MKSSRLVSFGPRSFAFTAATALAVTASAAPAENASPPPSTPETTHSYTDGGTRTVEVRTNYNDQIYSPRYYDNFRGPHNYPFNSGFSTTVRVKQSQIFLPPTPPALGEPVAAPAVEPTLTKVTLPPVLRSYFYESFYAPLSALMYSEDLSRRRRDTLDSYLAARTQALTALRAKIESLDGADPDVRARELKAFAATQTDFLTALENTSEEIRTNFVRGTWLQTGVDWGDLRSWRLGDDTRWESSLDEVKVVIGASFFEEGLSTPQRLLLRELAMELADGLRAPDAEISLSAPGPFFYFSPFTARIRLPAALPPELRAKIDEYSERKGALKRELRDELYKQDRAFWTSTRTTALKNLAAKQAPEFTVIERLAEEIRIGLAAFPNPARPPELALPPAVSRRITAYFATKTTWQKAMMEKLAELRAQLPDDRVEFSRLSGRPSIAITANRRSKPEQTSKRVAAEAALAVFNADQARLYDQLAREKELLRTEIFQIASTAAGRQVAKPIDQILHEFTYAVSRQETWLRYADYETAVLQPGLSPEQRRLLFGDALAKLGLPILNP